MWYNESAANKKVTIPILANALKKSSIYDILYYEYLCSHINKKYLQIYHEQEVDKMKRQGYNSPRAVPCRAVPCRASIVLSFLLVNPFQQIPCVNFQAFLVRIMTDGVRLFAFVR